MIRTSRKLIPKNTFYKLIGFKPTSAQLGPLYSQSKIKVLVGGRRSGKTLTLGIEDCRVLLSGSYIVWAVAPSYELAERAWRVVAETFWKNKSNPTLAAHMTPIKMSEGPGLRRAIFRNGAEFYALSAQDPDKSLLGAGVDRLHITEAARIKYRVYTEYLLPVIGDTKGTIVIDTTPRGKDWIYKLYNEGQDKKNIKRIQSWKFPSWTNTYAFPKGQKDPQIELLRASMSDQAFQQEICAEFTAFEGKLIPEFNASVQVIPHSEALVRSHYIKKYGGIDWGHTHPAVLVVGSYNEKTQEGIIIDEYCATELRVEQLLARAILMNQKYNVQNWFAGNDRPENKLAFSDHMNIGGAIDSHEIGLETLRVMSKNENCKLYISENCVEIIAAFENAHRKEIKGQLTDKWSDDYLDPLDATRYLYASIRNKWNQPVGALDKYLYGE